MKNQVTNWRRFLAIATSSALLKWQTVLAVVLLSVLIHLLASVDIGFEKILPRAGLAAVSVLPMFVLIKLSREKIFAKFQVVITIVAILVGGTIRGAIISSGLNVLEIQSRASSDFRMTSGAIISLAITLSIGYLSATLYEVRSMQTRLREDNKKLREILLQLSEKSEVQASNYVVDVLQYIKDQIQSVSSMPVNMQRDRLEELINGFVRPISKKWAQQLKEFQPILERSPEVTIRGIWRSLDVIENLPSPFYSTFIIIFTGYVSWVATFGRFIAFQLALAVGLTLYVSLKFGFYIARKYLGKEHSSLRNIALIFLMIVVTTPAVIASIAVLRVTDNPYASVLAGYITVPLLIWIYMIANAALNESDSITKELDEIQGKLKWAIARRNVLSWYQKGVFSRLLHGPVQNSIQVGLLRIQSAKSEREITQILDEILNRIDTEILKLSNESEFAEKETLALIDIKNTWQEIASINFRMPNDCQKQLVHDQAAFSIAVDLAQELTSNAIRHGNATQVDIQFETDSDKLTITSFDNGTPYSNLNNRSGVGTHFMESCSIQFLRTFNDVGNVYRLEIPIST